MSERIREGGEDKAHRRLIELLQELRVALPWVQVLFGFLLVVPFSARWGDVTPFQQDLYFACLLLSAAATACLIAPSAIHRLDFAQGDKHRIVEISTVLAIIGLTFMALAMIGVVLLITDILYGTTQAIGYTVGVALIFLVLWYMIPLLLRMRN